MIDSLPPEILYPHIVARLDVPTLLIFSRVSSEWRQIANYAQSYIFEPEKRDDRLETSALLIASLLRSRRPDSDFVRFVSKHQLRGRWAQDVIKELIGSYDFCGGALIQLTPYKVLDHWITYLEMLDDKDAANIVFGIHPEDWASYLRDNLLDRERYVELMKRPLAHPGRLTQLEHTVPYLPAFPSWEILLKPATLLNVRQYDQLTKIINDIVRFPDFDYIAPFFMRLVVEAWLDSEMGTSIAYHPIWKRLASIEPRKQRWGETVMHGGDFIRALYPKSKATKIDSSFLT